MRLRAITLAALALAAAGPAALGQSPYVFTNFNGPGDSTGGTTINGISNAGIAVGFDTDAAGNNHNFLDNTHTSTFTTLDSLLPAGSMANGVNSTPVVVGTTGTAAFTLQGNAFDTIPLPAGASNGIAFGINDHGAIVGQYTKPGGQMPGFVDISGTITTINAPVGPDTVFAQGINNNGLVVGFYQGNDGQDHGFLYSTKTGVFTQVADPTIPTVAGEPGATFVFSQILGINDQGLAVGYYGDSTLSQHGYFYNTNTGTYTFLDDPSAAFNKGVEVTQITGITNTNEIAGFYTDAGGLAHGFSAVPEPSTMALLGVGLAGMLGYGARRRMKPRA